MIDTLLKILDRLVQLRDYKTQKLDRVFEHIVQPTFDDLLIVHSDYLSMFREASYKLLCSSREQDLEALTNTVKNTVQFLEERRVEFEPVRVKLRQIVEQYAHFRFSQEIDKFIHSVTEYFPTGDIHHGTPSMSRSLIGELEAIAALDSRRVPEGQQDRLCAIAYEETNFFMLKLCEKWAWVCRAYGRVKLVMANAR